MRNSVQSTSVHKCLPKEIDRKLTVRDIGAYFVDFKAYTTKHVILSAE